MGNSCRSGFERLTTSGMAVVSLAQVERMMFVYVYQKSYIYIYIYLYTQKCTYIFRDCI